MRSGATERTGPGGPCRLSTSLGSDVRMKTTATPGGVVTALATGTRTLSREAAATEINSPQVCVPACTALIDGNAG